MSESTTLGAPFKHSLLSPDTKTLRPRISFRLKTTDVDNHDIDSRTCADGLYMLEVVDLSVSYAPVGGIKSLIIFITIASAEGMIIFILDISNSFQNIISPNPKERVYVSLPHLNLG